MVPKDANYFIRKDIQVEMNRKQNEWEKNKTRLADKMQANMEKFRMQKEKESNMEPSQASTKCKR